MGSEAGASWQVWKIIWGAPWTCEETMNAIGRGEQVGLFTGKPRLKEKEEKCCE